MKMRMKMKMNNKPQPLNKETNHKSIKINHNQNPKIIKIKIKETDHKEVIISSMEESQTSTSKEIKAEIKISIMVETNLTIKMAEIKIGKTKVETMVEIKTGKTIKEVNHLIIIKAVINHLINSINTDNDPIFI